MNTKFLLQRLDDFERVLPALVSNLSDVQMRWKPPSGNWSVLEIVCHLCDEEVHDFRARLMATIDDPSQKWPEIDPEKTVVDQQFNQRDPADAIEQFVFERKKSLTWLRSILDHASVNWNVAYQRSKFGPIKAGDLLASWVAHDQLHTRQIAKRIFELTVRESPTFSIAYAGELS